MNLDAHEHNLIDQLASNHQRKYGVASSTEVDWNGNDVDWNYHIGEIDWDRPIVAPNMNPNATWQELKHDINKAKSVQFSTK